MTASKLLARAICFGLILFGFGTVILAQSAADNLVIYAKAGRVNLVTGCAAVRLAGATAEKALAVSDELTTGDLVATGADAKVEILLSPGSYLRLGGNTEIKMIATDLEDVRLILRRGSAVVETGGGPKDAFRVQVAMPSGTAVIDQPGLYRLNVEGKRSELLVRGGGAIIQPAAIKVGEGKRVAVTTGVAEPIAKFDPNTAHDALDDWSQERARSLVTANGSLSQTELARAVRAPGGRDSSGGYWVYSPRLGYSVYVPADQAKVTSPYGFLYTIGSGGGWSVNNNPTARGTGEGPAPAVTPAGTRGSNQTPGRP